MNRFSKSHTISRCLIYTWIYILAINPTVSNAGILDHITTRAKGLAAKAGLYDDRFDQFKKLIESGRTDDAIKFRSEHINHFKYELEKDKSDYAYQKFENHLLKQLGELINEGLPAGAWELYLQSNKKEEITCLEQNKAECKRIFDAITEEIDKTLTRSINNIEKLSSNPYTQNNWIPLKRAIANMEKNLEAQFQMQSSHEISAPFEKSRTKLDSIKKNIVDASTEALRRYSLVQTPAFYEIYPIPVSMELIVPNLSLNEAGNWSIDAMRDIQKNYGKYLSDQQKIILRNSYLSKINKERRPGYLSARTAMDQARSDGFLLTDEGPLILVWHYKDLDKAVRLETSPMPNVFLRTAPVGSKPADLSSGARAEKASLLVFTFSGEEKVERSIKGSTRYSSASFAGRQRVRNPEYDKAVEKLARARSDLEQIKRQSQNVAGSSAFVVAMAAMAESTGEQDVRDAESALSNTPTQIDQDVNDQYHFMLNRTILLKRKPVNYLVIDVETARRCEGQTELLISDEYQVVSGLRPNDVNIKDPSLRGWINELVLEERARQSSTLPYRSLFDKVIDTCKEKL